jgi:serine/threonine protein kinase
MTDSSSPLATGDFFGVAAALDLLPDGADLELVREKASQSGLTPSQFALQQGLLDAVEVDIVETLAAPDDVAPGFRVLGLIGRGGMGVVYRAEQRALGRTVALKTILVSRMADKGVLDRFELEARTIGKLRHPNIIAAHDFGRHGSRVFLVMELVEGEDADHRVRREGPFDEPTAWGLARQAASGLAHAAQQQVVHRDVKPANLMLVPPPEGYPLPPGMPMVKLADFGLALLHGDSAGETRLTSADATLGSPHYMAPEQLETSDVDARADMYALGGTIYHLLTGRTPFAGMNLSQLIGAKLGSGPIPIETVRADLSEPTRQLVLRLLARRPDERPQTYFELLREIDRVLLRLPGPSGTVLVGSAAATPVLRDDNQPTTTFRRDVTPPVQALASAPNSSARWKRGLAWGLVIVAVSALVAAFVTTSSDSEVSLPGEPRPAGLSGNAVPLFNGTTTLGWDPQRGNWIADEGSLAGTNGVISKPLAMGWYRLELILEALPAGGDRPPAQELHFGLQTGTGVNNPRWVLRRSEGRVTFGSRQHDGAPFVADPRLPAIERPDEASLSVRLERLPEGWYAQIDEQPPVVGLPRQATGERPEIRLLAENGPVKFSDIYATALLPEP